MSESFAFVLVLRLRRCRTAIARMMAPANGTTKRAGVIESSLPGTVSAARSTTDDRPSRPTIRARYFETQSDFSG